MQTQIEKPDDAIPGNVNVQPPQLEAQGAKVHYFNPLCQSTGLTG